MLLLSKVLATSSLFFACDVEYWISVTIGVHTVQKVKRNNMLRKYVGSFTAEVRTGYFCHRFEVSSPIRGILMAPLITFGGPKCTNILQIRSGVALHANIYPEIFSDHLKGHLSTLL